MTGTLLTGSHDGRLVALSLAIAIAASYAALDLVGRMRASARWPRGAWLSAAALAMGGGVWSMHFVGMLAFALPLPVAHDPGLTALSLAIAVLVAGSGFAAVGRRGARSRAAALGGPLMGAGIAAMHYTGMAAMRVPADQRYDGPLVAASVLIAVGASTAALWLARRDSAPAWRLAAALAMGLAVAGMHYTAMQAVAWVPHAGAAPAVAAAVAAGAHHHAHAGLGPAGLALAVAAVTFLLLFLALAAALLDRRFAALAEREAKLALRESEGRLRALADNLPSGMVYQVAMRRDGSDRRFVYVSGSCERLTGVLADAALADPAALYATIAPEDRPALAAAEAAAIRDRAPFEFEARLVRAGDGAARWCRLAAAPREAPDGTLVWDGLLVDVTERRAAEAALAASEARFRGTFEQAAVGIAHVAPDGRWLLVNDRLCAILGRGREELLGLTFQDVTHPEDLEADLAQVRALLAGEIATYSMEKRYLRGGGGVAWADLTVSLVRDAAGRPERFIAVVEDIAARKAAEAALAAGEARLRSVVETAADGILVADAAGRIASANPAALRMFGYGAAEELVGRDLAALMPAAEAVRHGARLAARLRGADGGSPARTIGVPGRELLAVRRDGSEFPIELSVASFRCGEERFFTGVVRDATERKRAEELRALLAREVDHRAKNALAVALSVLRLTPKDDPARFAASVEGRVAALARAHSLLATGGWSGAELRAVAEGELAAHAGRVSVSGPRACLAAAAVQPLAMLLHELATNAAKHGALAREQGRVALSWGFEGADGALRLRWVERGGPPVPRPPARRGFGSRLMALLAGQQLGGSVAFDWAEAGLSCAIALAPRFVAPADDPAVDAEGGQAGAGDGEATKQPAVPAGKPVAGGGGAGRRPRVLVVEDEALLAAELAEGLRGLGCEAVGPARSLAEALRLARAEPELSAAVLDVNLGDGEMSFPAMELLEGRGVPYVVATGYGSARSLDGHGRGAVAVLRKPYAREALAEVLAAALRCGPPAGAAPPGAEAVR